MEEGDQDSAKRTPRYQGEDVRPTSKMEMWGWYTYGLAAEVFAVCGVGTCVHCIIIAGQHELTTLHRLVPPYYVRAACSGARCFPL